MIFIIMINPYRNPRSKRKEANTIDHRFITLLIYFLQSLDEKLGRIADSLEVGKDTEHSGDNGANAKQK